jgi:pimeloyl-ACP methyl ester carboxylesterase
MTTGSKFNILAVDQRGHGESPLGDETTFTIDAMVADLHAAIHQQGLLAGGQKVVLLGHSMGGRVAMAYVTIYWASVCYILPAYLAAVGPFVPYYSAPAVKHAAWHVYVCCERGRVLLAS